MVLLTKGIVRNIAVGLKSTAASGSEKHKEKPDTNTKKKEYRTESSIKSCHFVPSCLLQPLQVLPPILLHQLFLRTLP